MNKKYEMCKWAVAHKIDAKHYDDNKERIRAVAFFSTRDNAQDYINKCLPAETKDRFFIIFADEL